MKKYKVKKEHPALQEGEMRKNGPTYDFVSKSGFCLWLSYSESVIKEWISEGWIEEIQELELTKNEAIKYAKYCEDSLKRVFSIDEENSFAMSPHYNYWIKNYKDEK